MIEATPTCLVLEEEEEEEEEESITTSVALNTE